MESLRNVSVIGLGKLGSPMVAVFARRGHHVVGVDVNPKYVEAIDSGRAPVFEPGLDQMLSDNKERIRATADLGEAIRTTDITFVVVATPSDEEGGFSLRYVLPACESIGRELANKDGYHLIVLTSTVLPGACEAEIRPALERASGKRCGRDFGLCYSPEFIALGSVLKDLVNPDFFLVGEDDERAGSILEEFYSTIAENGAPSARMNLVNAEIAKLSVNTFVTTKISFANMISGICERVPGADVDVVTAALGRDKRIGSRYLKGALGYGGPCFPRDNVALTHLAERLGAPAELAAATDAINRDQVPHLAELIRARLEEGGKVAVLGLSYKPDTDVIDESQGVQLAQRLADAGLDVHVYDPAAMTNARRTLSAVTFSDSVEAATSGAGVIVVTTPWSDFSQLRVARDDGLPGKRVVIDCWRILDRSALDDSVEYVALGVGE